MHTGGVLFSVEEVSSYFPARIIWLHTYIHTNIQTYIHAGGVLHSVEEVSSYFPAITIWQYTCMHTCINSYKPTNMQP
jgi:hypothetical protein